MNGTLIPGKYPFWFQVSPFGGIFLSWNQPKSSLFLCRAWSAPVIQSRKKYLYLMFVFRGLDSVSQPPTRCGPVGGQHWEALSLNFVLSGLFLMSWMWPKFDGQLIYVWPIALASLHERSGVGVLSARFDFLVALYIGGDACALRLGLNLSYKWALRRRCPFVWLARKHRRRRLRCPRRSWTRYSRRNRSSTARSTSGLGPCRRWSHRRCRISQASLRWISCSMWAGGTPRQSISIWSTASAIAAHTMSVSWDVACWGNPGPLSKEISVLALWVMCWSGMRWCIISAWVTSRGRAWWMRNWAITRRFPGARRSTFISAPWCSRIRPAISLMWHPIRSLARCPRRSRCHPGGWSCWGPWAVLSFWPGRVGAGCHLQQADRQHYPCNRVRALGIRASAQSSCISGVG